MTLLIGLRIRKNISYIFIERLVFLRKIKIKLTNTICVICPPGNGNVGDQAMIDSVVENSRKKIIFIVENDYSNTFELKGNVLRVEKIPGLIYGSYFRRLVAYISYRKLLNEVDEVYLIGADIMDGCYNSLASVNRANLVYMAKMLGLPTRVLGFSWSENAEETASMALKRAAKKGVQLFVRDPVSYERLKKLKFKNLICSADLVFSSSFRDMQVFDNNYNLDAAKNRKLAILNISGLVGVKFGDRYQYIEKYTTIVEGLLVRGYMVIILPHVFREDDSGDLAVSKLLFDKFPRSNHVQLITNKITPSEVRALCSYANIIVTGRMHLAIIGLSQRVLSIAISTQGKVEGLYKMFSLDMYVVNPDLNFNNKINDLIELGDREDGFIGSVSDRDLDNVKKLSMKNFS